MQVTMPSPRATATSVAGTGSAYFPIEASLFTLPEWSEIERIVEDESLPWEKVTIGDADEPNDVHVARFMTDIDQPRMVNEPLSTCLLSIIGSQRIIGFFQEMLNAPELHIRRVQVNKMETGSFVGLHLDKDSNPDYEISVVLQIGKSFRGGEFVVHAGHGTQYRYEPAYRSMLVSRCDFRHEVRPVMAGERTSLVFFFSRDNAKNKRVKPV